MKNPKYLVRPSDFNVFEFNGKFYEDYRGKINHPNHQHGNKFWTYDLLTNTRNKFFEIDENDLDYYLQENEKYYDNEIKRFKNDGHGGSEINSLYKPYILKKI